jgi:hypothetical protein
LIRRSTLTLLFLQIKLKKTSTDTQPSTAPPVMVAPPPNTGFQPHGTGSGMLLPPINYSADPHSMQPMYGNTYTYNNGFVTSVPPPNSSGGDAPPTYYNYNTGSAPGQQGHMPMQQQMYVPQYQVNSIPGTLGASTGTSGYTGMNYNTYVPPTHHAQSGPAGLGPAGQHQYSRGAPAVSGSMNQPHPTSGGGIAISQQGQVPQGQLYGQYAPNSGSAGPGSKSYGMSQTYGKADNSGMSYGQHMRTSQVPTSYYGNTGGGVANSAPNTSAGGVHPVQHTSQPHYVPPTHSAQPSNVGAGGSSTHAPQQQNRQQ